jgi:hypothetical protein
VAFFAKLRRGGWFETALPAKRVEMARCGPTGEANIRPDSRPAQLLHETTFPQLTATSFVLEFQMTSTSRFVMIPSWYPQQILFSLNVKALSS